MLGFVGMKAQLQALSQEDAATILIVRRIQKLGFKSPEILRKHFEDVGEVKGVHVAHSTVKTAPRVEGSDREPSYRQRPAALGFVVMHEPQHVEKILKEGPERTIQDVKVLVQAFERHDDVDGKDGSGDSDSEDGYEREGGRRAKRGARGRQATRGAGVRSRSMPRKSPRRVEESPLCPICGSTVASRFGVRICQVCKRGFVHVLEDRFASNKMPRRAY